MADEANDAMKTPVTIVTGFLGAGKTTLVNHILRGQHGLQIAVIENEFGAVSIDDALVSENMKEKEDIISMDNGCVCCTVRGDLVRALLTLKDRKKKFDAVIIETTGLADPAPVAQTFWRSRSSSTRRLRKFIESIVSCASRTRNTWRCTWKRRSRTGR